MYIYAKRDTEQKIYGRVQAKSSRNDDKREVVILNDLFYKFEKDIMTAIIKKESGISENLYAQYIHSNVVSREFTGYGFYTTYAVNPKYKIKTIKMLCLGT